jgi:hypothetical protein
MVLMLSTSVFTADPALEQEIFALRNAKRTFDGVEILKPTHEFQQNSPNCQSQ